MFNLNDFQSIYIYQYGKVGSSTLQCTFKKYHDNVIHTHQYDEKMMSKKTLIINVVRNLYDRNISAFFHNINNYKHGLFYYCPDTDNKNIKIDNLINFFRNCNIRHLNEKIAPWFKNFNDKFNINIFSKEFDNKKKYNIYNTSGPIILTLRFEDINDWENILSNIFNIKIELHAKNITEKKKIVNIYNKFKKEYKYSDEEIKIIDNIDHFLYFYTSNEIENFKKKYD